MGAFNSYQWSACRCLITGLPHVPCPGAVTEQSSPSRLFKTLPSVGTGIGSAERPLRGAEGARVTGVTVAPEAAAAIDPVGADAAVATDLVRACAVHDLTLAGGACVAGEAEAGVAVGGEGGCGQADAIGAA